MSENNDNYDSFRSSLYKDIKQLHQSNNDLPRRLQSIQFDSALVQKAVG